MQPVAQTLLIPLWARAAEMRKRRPLVNDPRALEICERIDFDFDVFRRSYGTQIGCVLRGLLYDQWVNEFLNLHPSGTVVELGAGLSTRYERIDNGTARWIDVDLPDAMELRERHFTPSARRTFIAGSVADAAWIRHVQDVSSGPYFFVSEGMLMYVEPRDVRRLLTSLADVFGPTEMALDSIAPFVVRHQKHHDSMKHMMDAPFRWGTSDIHEIESWDPRLVVRDVASLADIARLFHDRVPLSQRIVGSVMSRAVPRITSAYRLSRITIGA